MSEAKQHVIGIDGGGTKTQAILVAMDGAVLAEAAGGPSSLSVVTIKDSIATVFELIKQCCEKAATDASSLTATVIGLSGAGRLGEKTEFQSSLIGYGVKKKFSLHNVRIETDGRIALEAAFAGGPGVVVISGTGSIALYRTEDDKIIRAGGWGKILGDEGSGFAIGRDGLAAVFRQADGRGEKTILTQKALEHFQVAGTDEILTKIYHEHADIASFAPKVLEAVVERDRTAHMVIVGNANNLAEHVRVLVMQVRPKARLPVALMGGLLESENVFSKLVREKINHSLPQVVVQRPKFPAAFGAAILGLNAFR